jgi:hypothetical protein
MSYSNITPLRLLGKPGRVFTTLLHVNVISYGLPGVVLRYSYSTNPEPTATATGTGGQKRGGHTKEVDDFNYFASTRPSEVLFQNIPAMENRLFMFDMFRMKRQLEIDMEQLRILKCPYTVPQSAKFRFETRINVFPGLRQPIMSNIHRRVLVSFKVSDIGSLLSDSAKHKLKLLCMQRYHTETDTVKIACERFPFREQNEQYIRDVLAKLFEEAAKNPEEFADIDLLHKENSNNRGRNRKQRSCSLESWLDSISKRKSTSTDINNPTNSIN